MGNKTQKARSPCPLWETRFRPKRRDRHVPAGRHGSDPKSEITVSPLGDTAQTQKAKSPCPRWETRFRPKRNHRVPAGRHGSDPKSEITISPLGDTVQTQTQKGEVAPLRNTARTESPCTGSKPKVPAVSPAGDTSVGRYTAVEESFSLYRVQSPRCVSRRGHCGQRIFFSCIGYCF